MDDWLRSFKLQSRDGYREYDVCLLLSAKGQAGLFRKCMGPTHFHLHECNLCDLGYLLWKLAAKFEFLLVCVGCSVKQFNYACL